MPRTHTPRAYAELPPSWCEAIVEEYVQDGWEVEWGIVETDRTKGWLRIHGLPQRELNQQLNDPLGEPGKRETRHPLSGRHRKKKRKPMSEHDYLLCVEEARYCTEDI